MSLWCGACRKMIFGPFGMLYRMNVVDGSPSFRRPNVPPNSAVCDPCWKLVPAADLHDDHRLAMNEDRLRVFGFARADSGTSPMTGSKQWSDIATADEFVFVHPDVVTRCLPLVFEIILIDTRERGGVLYNLRGRLIRRLKDHP